jgi:CDP-diacylglycerol--glycerol-3-phosphate 3-phosphatidyltransferase
LPDGLRDNNMTANSEDLSQPTPSRSLYTLPNALSVLRGLAGPVVLALVTTPARWALIAALVLMVAAELSDVFDGEIARRFDQETQLGRFIDPICDSVYHLSVFLAFLGNGWMPAWMLFVVYARDLVVPYFRTFVRQVGEDLPVRLSGKIKTAVHAAAQIGVVAMALGLLGGGQVMHGPWPLTLLAAATIVSVYSLIDYGVEVMRVVRAHGG